jgi:hypothetical protein
METAFNWSRRVAISSSSDAQQPPNHADQSDCTEDGILTEALNIQDMASAWRMAKICRAETYRIPGPRASNRWLAALFKQENISFYFNTRTVNFYFVK